MVLLLLAGNSGLYAQTAASGFFELAAGPSFPTGRFGDKSFSGRLSTEKKPAGAAKTGFSTQATAGYQLTSTVAVLLSGGLSWNKQDEAAVEKMGLSQTPSPFVKAETENWKTFRLLAGGQFSAPIAAGSKLLFQVRLQAGACKTTLPGYTYAVWGDDLYDPIASVTVSDIKLPWTFCYQVGAGFRYPASGKFYLLGDLSFFNAHPVYALDYEWQFPQPVSIHLDQTYSLSSVNVLVGAGIRL